MSNEKIIKSLTPTQKKNLLEVYEKYKKTGIKSEDKKHQLGIGLKTGYVLYKRGLVEWSYFQLSYWTMWEITEKGIEIAEELVKK